MNTSMVKIFVGAVLVVAGTALSNKGVRELGGKLMGKQGPVQDPSK